MKEVHGEGIVLRARTKGEDDLLVDLLTPDCGRISGIARHGRKSWKRFGTILEVPNLLRVRYRDRGSLVSLREAVLERPLIRLGRDLGRLMGAFYLVDIVRESVQERSPDPRLYALLKDSLMALDEGATPRKVLSDFELRFLALWGYGPDLGRCFSCRRPWSSDGDFFFVFREGGISCAGCRPSGTPSEAFSKDSGVLSRFIEYQLGHPLKAARFMTGVI